MIKGYLSIGEVNKYLTNINYLSSSLDDSLGTTIKLLLDLINERKIAPLFHYVGILYKVTYKYDKEEQLFSSRTLLNTKELLDFYDSYLEILDLRDINHLFKGEREKISINELVRVIPINMEKESDVNYEIEQEYLINLDDIRFSLNELEKIFTENNSSRNTNDSTQKLHDNFGVPSLEHIPPIPSHILTIIEQLKAENKELRSELERFKQTSKSDKPSNNIKESIYQLINAMKDLLLDPLITQSLFIDKDNQNAKQKPTQDMLAQHIESMNIRGLAKRNINGIFAEANKLKK